MGKEQVPARFIGRLRELDQLDAAVTGVADGRGGTILLAGSSGMGASRLLDELESRIVATPRRPITLLRSDRLPAWRGAPYRPVRYRHRGTPAHAFPIAGRRARRARRRAPGPAVPGRPLGAGGRSRTAGWPGAANRADARGAAWPPRPPCRRPPGRPVPRGPARDRCRDARPRGVPCPNRGAPPAPARRDVPTRRPDSHASVPGHPGGDREAGRAASVESTLAR